MNTTDEKGEEQMDISATGKPEAENISAPTQEVSDCDEISIDGDSSEDDSDSSYASAENNSPGKEVDSEQKNSEQTCAQESTLTRNGAEASTSTVTTAGTDKTPNQILTVSNNILRLKRKRKPQPARKYLRPIPTRGTRDKLYEFALIGNLHGQRVVFSQILQNVAVAGATLGEYINQLLRLETFRTATSRGVICSIFICDIGGSDLHRNRLFSQCMQLGAIEASRREYTSVAQDLHQLRATILQIHPQAIIVGIPVIYRPGFRHEKCGGECFYLTQCRIRDLSNSLCRPAYHISDIAYFMLRPKPKLGLTDRDTLKKMCLYRRSAFEPNEIYLNPNLYLRLKVLLHKVAGIIRYGI
jgi:hypothetical protein